MNSSLDSHQSSGVAGGSANGNGNRSAHGPVNGTTFIGGSSTNRSWEVVLRSLQQLFRNQIHHIATPFRTVSWYSIPQGLAERGLFLQGVPYICAPVIRGNQVQDDLSSWTREKLNALDMALKNGSLQIQRRDPISRRAVFQLVDHQGVAKDSCLGFSPEWQLTYMFSETMYQSFTIPILRTMNLAGFIPVLENLKVSPNQFPWVSLPSKLWAAEYYLSGLPRICLPPVKNDRIPSDTPSPTTRWRKDQRIAVQRVLDAGVLKLVKRPPGRNVIFEVLEEDGSLQDEDCGFSDNWKATQTIPGLPRSKRPPPRPYVENPPKVLAAIPTPVSPMLWQLPSDGFSKKLAILDFYGKLLGNHGLLMESPEGPAWVYVPQMLATKRLYIYGLPRACLPRVMNDDVISNYDPRQWNLAAQDQFLAAFEHQQVQVHPRLPGQRVLYEVPDESGAGVLDTLGFSESWCHENLDIVDLSDPDLPLPVYVVEMWLGLLEGVNIPCHDHRGRRRIPWVHLPMYLAHRRLYVYGCPMDCMPKVNEDIVDELSSPYFYDDYQVSSMKRAFKSGRVSIKSRTAPRNVIFTGEVNGAYTDVTCGFSPGWIQLNLHTVPNSIPTKIMNMAKGHVSRSSASSSVSNPRRQSVGSKGPPQISGFPISYPHNTLPSNPSMSSLQSFSASSTPPFALVPSSAPASMSNFPLSASYSPDWSAHPENSANIPNARISGPSDIRPRIPDTPTPSSSSRYSTTPPLSRPSSVRPEGSHERSPSLTIIIPAFKRRHRVSSSLSITETAVVSESVVETETQAQMIRDEPQEIVDEMRSRPISPPPPPPHSLALARSMSTPSMFAQREPPPSPVSSVRPLESQVQPPSEEIGPKTSSVPHLLLASNSGSTTHPRPIIPLRRKTAPSAPTSTPDPAETSISSLLRQVGQPRRGLAKIAPHTRSATAAATAALRTVDQPSANVSFSDISEDESDDDPDRPGSFGHRTQMSPPLPPKYTLPDDLPLTPLPTFLPIPGGNLAWNEELSVWELTISELWPPDSWKKSLPFFPARVFWNAAQKVWMCEPSQRLRRPDIKKTILSPAVLASLNSAKMDGPLPKIEPGLSVIWHRWRRAWGLFEYTLPITATDHQS